MTAEEYKETRKQLGLTQAELAARLEVSLPTIKRREAGSVPITKEADIAIKTFIPRK